MQLPLQITYRNMDPSPALEARIREKADKLEQIYDQIMGCRVVVEAPPKHKNKGGLFHCHIDITVPGGEIAVSREPDQRHAHEDVYVVLRDAFDAARRQLEDYARRQRGDVKTHTAPGEQAS
jgi:ribosome-associated translation inhibitor RaiA